MKRQRLCDEGMVQIQKHASLNDPPPGKIFETQKKSRKVVEEATNVKVTAVNTNTGINNSKWVWLRK